MTHPLTDETLSSKSYLEPVPVDYKAAFFILARKVSIMKFFWQYSHYEQALDQAEEAVRFIDAVEKTAGTFQVKENN